MSDVHLNLRPRAELIAALVGLIRSVGRGRLVFVGDLFEFSAIDSDESQRVLEQLTACAGDVVDALRQHVAAGGTVDWIAGNHDAPVVMLGQQVARLWAVPVRVIPWFAQYHGVHVEHGHLYDRDNAPIHPLAAWRERDEPVGIALMRRFVTRYGVPEFAHAHQTTPWSGIQRGIRLFGLRVPQLFGAYLSTAIEMCLQCIGRRPAQLGIGAEDWSSLVNSGVPSGQLENTVRTLFELRPTPTHARFGSTFMRLHLDAVSSMAVASLGLVGGLSGVGHAAWAGTGLGATYLLASRRPRRTPRFPGPEQALERAALRLAERLGLAHVVFGHSHVAAQRGPYVNLGSFGYPEAPGQRPYAVINANNSVELKHWRGDPERL